MSKYVPITDTLCLVEQEVKSKANKTVFKRTAVNHLWVFDRSGSMGGLLNNLTQQLIILSKNLVKGDILSLGYFSGEGQYDWIFKGFKITDESDYKALEIAIKKNSSTIGLTCFSEILENTSQVIKDLSVLSKTFSLSFLTDGYPVVSNYKNEIESINKAIKNIQGKISSSILIGFGPFYNKELMNEMACKLGAMLIHSSDIKEYTPIILRLVKLTDSSEPKEEVTPLVSSSMAIFTITDQGVVLYSLDEDGKLLISPTAGKSTKIYYISEEKPNKKSWDKVEVSAINFGDENDTLAKAIYASTLVLTQQAKTDIALEVIGKAGDKALVDALNNAFQIEEYGAAEEVISKGINDVALRFSKGRDPAYLPPTDAFCVFNLVKILMEDEKAAFFPYDKRYQYERIGVSSKPAEGYPKFEADITASCPFNNLTWHESRLNLSVLTKIPGTIKLHDVGDLTPKKAGLPEDFPVHVFRNFTVIKDGRVSMKKMFISTSEDTYKTFKNYGIVFEDTFKKDGIYGIDITPLPAVNRKIAKGKASALDLSKMAMQEQELRAQIKALKYLKEQVVGSDFAPSSTAYTQPQIVLLEAHGVSVDKGCSYSPPTVKEDAKDKYMAKSFEIKIKGMSSLPPVKKVMEKIASDKSRTPVESLLEEGIKTWKAVAASFEGKEKEAELKKKWFEGILKSNQSQMLAIRSQMQSQKFATILGKMWYFPTRAENTIEVDGREYVFELSEEAVEI